MATLTIATLLKTSPCRLLIRQAIFPHIPRAPVTSHLNLTSHNKFLDILEMIDTQGLLDRVFPLPTDSSGSPVAASSQSSPQPQSYSFRTLLKESSRHSLRVLRSAVQPLFPVFAHPRSRPSAPAAQQLNFCNLALSLLDQASFRTPESILDLETIIPADPEATTVATDDSTTADSSKHVDAPFASPDLPRKRKYALMQRLPSGEWWSSLNSDIASLDGSDLKNLPTAHAELAAILPSASAPEASGSSIPTLGSLSRKLHTKKPTLPGPRHLSTGSFLDYGPNASFSPSFEQDGVEVGRFGLGEVLWSRLRRTRFEFPSKPPIPHEQPSATAEDVQMAEVSQDGDRSQRSDGEIDQGGGQQIVLDPLLQPDQVAPIQDVMNALEFEATIQELLERNNRAITRLEELQTQRLGGENGGTSQVEVASEEWDLAQSITESLALLASLRPRSTKDTSSLIPPSEFLRKLHRSLPSEPSEGWFGTLPPSNLTALRDDTTLQIKAGVSIPVGTLPGAGSTTLPSAAISSGTPTTTANKPTAQATYANFTYPSYGGNQYRGAYAYTPSTNPYYPNAYAQASGQTAQPGQGSQPYIGQQQQYNTYGSWYNYQQHQTPGQPPTPTSLAASYASFFNSQQSQQQQQNAPRAVANTVTAGKAAPGSWTATPTLPHLRPGVTTQPPGTPTPAGQGNYYYPGPYPPATGAR
ncbi:hypothetical protein F5148DRAFT_1328816 [Russula earlei]|uniref:Uncharacterized protein n=1 Tax=Russula earlei TaxID=71964 RepID=A0ACC0UN56_9AGAM|nr:hypothetical protein F5148DRAFT_1328816 [Russula earlei]